MATLGMVPIEHIPCIVAFISALQLYIRTLIFRSCPWRDCKIQSVYGECPNAHAASRPRSRA